MDQAITLFDVDGRTMIGNTALPPNLLNAFKVGEVIKLYGVEYRWGEGMSSLIRVHPVGANRHERRAARARSVH